MQPEDLIYPRTRFQVLRILNTADAPVSLSAIADRADLVIGSVQQAVTWLTEQKLVSVHKNANRMCYKITNKSVKEIISKVTEVLESFEIKERSKQYQNRARNLLKDLDDRRDLITHARSSIKK